MFYAPHVTSPFQLPEGWQPVTGSQVGLGKGPVPFELWCRAVDPATVNSTNAMVMRKMFFIEKQLLLPRIWYFFLGNS